MNTLLKQDRVQSAFVATFFFVLIFSWLFIDVVAPYYFPSFNLSVKTDKRELKVETIALDAVVALSQGSLTRKDSAKEAKSAGLFWMANADGKGAAIDLLGHAPLIGSLYPGYGQALVSDKLLWRNYFESEFGPASFLNSKPEFSRLGFRVSYSWTGCLDIYEKYGADVLVFGSSEVYESLIPEQFANELAPLFSSSPKVLFCLTPAMTMETVRMTTEEMVRLPGGKPKIIVWGYSFWQSYMRSTKLAAYQKEQNREFAEYVERKRVRGESGWYSAHVRQIVRSKGANFFPRINWDDVLSFSFAKARGIRAQQENTDQEGIELARAVFEQDDAQLSTYLNANLKPYYDITRGILEEDCSLEGAAHELYRTISSLKKLSPNVYLYLAPTTMHHRRTVPPCFLPNVKAMLEQVSSQAGIHLLDQTTEEFGLTDRDFIYPTLNPDKFYFDINHANYFGGQKITKKIGSWVFDRWSESPNRLSR